MQMRTRLVAAVGSVVIAAGAGVAIPSVTAHAAAPRMVVGLGDVWESNIQNDETQLGGFHSAIVGIFLNWQKDPSTSGMFNTDTRQHGSWLNWVRNRSAVPMLDLFPPSGVSLSSIASGGQDAYLYKWAVAFKTFNHPVLFRLFPEMNATESYRPTGKAGYTTTNFISAWRHVWNLFHGKAAFKGHYVNAPQVRFVWNPYRPYSSAVPLAKVWPGAGYVNWLSLDIYNFADSSHGPSQSAYNLTKPAVAAVRKVAGTTKPLFLAELGTNEIPGHPSGAGSKADWLVQAYRYLQNLGVRAIVYYDENQGTAKWRFDSSSASLAGGKKALSQSTVIRPPSISMSQLDNFAVYGTW